MSYDQLNIFQPAESFVTRARVKEPIEGTWKFSIEFAEPFALGDRIITRFEDHYQMKGRVLLIKERRKYIPIESNQGNILCLRMGFSQIITPGDDLHLDFTYEPLEIVFLKQKAREILNQIKFCDEKKAEFEKELGIMARLFDAANNSPRPEENR